MSSREPLEPLKIRRTEKARSEDPSVKQELPPLRRAAEPKPVPVRPTVGSSPAAPSPASQEKSPASRRTSPSERSARSRSRTYSRLRFWFTVCLALFVVVMGTAVGAGIGFLNNYLDQMPVVDYLENYQPYMPSRMWDQNGREKGLMFADFFTNEQSRQMVTLNEIPRYLIDALICTEDREFFDHFGVSIKGIVRAAIVDIKTMSKKQGASTITIQLAEDLYKNKHLPYDVEELNLKSWKQKIREAFLALQIEKRYTKEEILEIYLNQVYLGDRYTYGVAKAAEFYFGKKVKDLSLKECALFAAMLKAPNALSPLKNIERAGDRTALVLKLMYNQGKITQEEYEQAVQEPFRLAENVKQGQVAYYPYYSWTVHRQLSEQAIKSRDGGKIEVLGQGVDIETCLDPALQEIAEEALKKGIIAQEQQHRKNGGEYWGLPDGKGRPNALSGSRIRAASEEFDAQIVNAFDPDTGTVDVTIPNVEGGKGPFTVAVDPDKTWLDDFDVLQKGYYIRVNAVERDGEVHVALGENKYAQGSIVVVRPSTGEVLALVGGYNYYDKENGGQYIRAVQSTQVQPGSSFKPLLYTAALSDPKKWTVASRILDQEGIEFWKGWSPKNYEDEYLGNITMRYALAHSKNVGSVWLLDNLKESRSASIQALRNFCSQAFDYHLPQANLSVALGTEGMSPFQLAQAYQVLANRGDFIRIHMIERIFQRQSQQAFDQVLYEFNQPVSDMRRIDPKVAYLATYLMRAVVEDGTAKEAAKLPFYNVGKTGTTDDCAYAWYAGYTKDLLCVVYFGYDDFGHSLGVKRTGSKVALPVWSEFMTKAYEKYPDWFGEIEPPQGIVFKNICQYSRAVANDACPNAKSMPFIEGSQPKASCSVHGKNYSPAPYQYQTIPVIMPQNQ